MTTVSTLPAHGCTTDGGARVGEADLWCSYAAVRALRWCGAGPADPDGVAGYLSARCNADGGYAWQRGLPSDAWATYYCTQALADLGRPAPAAALASWLPRLRRADGGFGMSPQAPADVWATYYATRTYAEVLRVPVPDVAALVSWLAACQVDDGGMAWQPGGPTPDTRAGYYAAVAWRAAAGAAPPPFRRDALVEWLQARQGPDGGLAFAPGMRPCAWAAFRGVRALAALDAAPADRGALVDWLRARRQPDGGYERWVSYGRSDVWAAFSVIGALSTLDALDGTDLAATATVLRAYQLPHSGFTYRAPEAAGDSLATAAALLDLPPGDPDAAALAGWLTSAQMPFEDGVMYMPGRGAEIRCTLWAASALHAHGRQLDRERLARWLRELQNPDGGYGYWHGRGSDVVSTVSALELVDVAGIAADAVDPAGAADFLHAADDDSATADDTAAELAMRARGLALVGDRPAGTALARALPAYASPLGGYASRPRAIPDLASTYQVVRTELAFGTRVDTAALARFLAKIRTPDGYAWSPLSRESAGPLATCLGNRLDQLAAGTVSALPALNL